MQIIVGWVAANCIILELTNVMWLTNSWNSFIFNLIWTVVPAWPSLWKYDLRMVYCTQKCVMQLLDLLSCHVTSNITSYSYIIAMKFEQRAKNVSAIIQSWKIDKGFFPLMVKCLKEAIILIPLQQVAGFNYTCRIRETMFPATRNNRTSLTCEIASNEVSATSKSFICFKGYPN